jgi:hypothetical protein
MSVIVKHMDESTKAFVKTATSKIKKDNLSLICASCVLFGPHQKHDILALKDASMYIRNNINTEIKKGNIHKTNPGMLKKEFCETHLLEIREYNLRVEKYKSDTIKKIDEAFKEIIKTLKLRKNELISEVLEKFKTEKEKIAKEEDKWTNKQDTSEKLLGIMNDRDDRNILVNSKHVLDGLKSLNEDLSFKEIKVYNNLDTTLYIERLDDKTQPGITLSLEEIVQYLSSYMTICEPNILEYKS